MAKKGDWVRIHSIVLKADERTAKLPEDTQKCDLQMWTKGFLEDETAEIGDVVTVKTAVNRFEKRNSDRSRSLLYSQLWQVCS